MKRLSKFLIFNFRKILFKFELINVKYSNRNTYFYSIDKFRLDSIVKTTNRSTTQTEFLFQLVDGDIDRLLLVELFFKNNHINGCPSSKKELKSICNI